MTTFPTEHETHIAETIAARDVQEAAENRRRLLDWKARYPYDTVFVPEPKEPPKWPAVRCSIPPLATVTRLRPKVRAGA